MRRQMAEKMPWKAVGLGGSGIFQPIQGVLTDELIIHQAENQNFCHRCSCNFPDCSAPAKPFFCQAVCLQRRIKPKEVVSTTQASE